MDFNCSEPLGDKLELYLEDDMTAICKELHKNGIVYESQFHSLWSKVCKHNSFEMTKLFSRNCNLTIFYGYDQITCNFFYYDINRYTKEEAMRKSILYHDGN